MSVTNDFEEYQDRCLHRHKLEIDWFLSREEMSDLFTIWMKHFWCKSNRWWLIWIRFRKFFKQIPNNLVHNHILSNLPNSNRNVPSSNGVSLGLKTRIIHWFSSIYICSYPKIKACHIRILSSEGTAAIPAGGSFCNLSRKDQLRMINHFSLLFEISH